ncbi:MAG: tetratricopeptide repeat protein [Limisphaerales bacterium]
MKANQLVLLFLFLVLGVATAQQTNLSPGITNSDTFSALIAKAEKGDVKAQSTLADSYYGATNYTEAANWCRRAAEQGDLNAQKNLGWMYKVGEGVPQDDTESGKWYHKAAEQGDAQAQSTLGGMYERGQGLTQDYAEAVKWYRRAAEQGDIFGESGIATCYYAGEGVPKNYVESYKWLNLVSAHTGNNDTERKLVEYSAKLREGMANLGEITPDQIAEAQQLSAAFVPKKETPSSSFDNSISSNNPRFSGTGFFITDDGLFDFKLSCGQGCDESSSGHERRIG